MWTELHLSAQIFRISKCSITSNTRRSRLGQTITDYQTHTGKYKFPRAPSTRGGIMRFFLLSALFMVSAGEDVVTVTGFETENVLLPCNCSTRNLNKELKWQVEDNEKRMALIYIHNETLNVKDNRFETSFLNDSSNCSVLLKNITPDDARQYRCIFYVGNIYTYTTVNLNVCGRNISQYNHSTPSGGKVYGCVVKLGCNTKTEIQWKVDGKCLKNSSTTNISTTDNLDEATGFPYFDSTLKTELSFTSEPKCEVSATCPAERFSGPKPDISPNPYFRTLCKLVPVVLMLGFLLIRCRRGTSHSCHSKADV